MYAGRTYSCDRHRSSLPRGVVTGQNFDPSVFLETPYCNLSSCLFIFNIIIGLNLEGEEDMFTASVVKPKPK